MHGTDCHAETSGQVGAMHAGCPAGWCDIEKACDTQSQLLDVCWLAFKRETEPG